MIAIISIRYNGYDATTYEGVCATIDDLRDQRVMNTGEPARDYDAAVLWAVEQGADQIYGSSTLDDFAADGGERVG